MMSSAAVVGLTEEQQAQIAINKRRALELRKRKLEEEEERQQIQQLQENGKEEEEEEEVRGPRCEVCKTRENLNAGLLEAFGVGVCKACASQTTDYDLINKTDVSSQFCIPDDVIGMLKFKERPNPKKPGWAPMKLYLVKHAREASYKRWKDEEGLEKEKARREAKKYDRDLAKSQKAAAGGGEEDGIFDNDGSNSILAKMLQVDEDEPTPSSSSSSSKHSLAELLGDIGGDKKKKKSRVAKNSKSSLTDNKEFQSMLSLLTKSSGEKK